MNAPDLFQEPARPVASHTEGPVTLSEMIACVAREVKLRHAVYPGQIQRGKMTKQEADREARRMEAVLEYLKLQREREIETQDGS
jgi:hypothetical protein